MQNPGRFTWCVVFSGLAIILNGCAGGAINKKIARDAILQTPGDGLTQKDLDVFSITQVGSREAIVQTNLRTAFRLEKTGGAWRVREVRVGRGEWQRVDDIFRALRQIQFEETRLILEKVAIAIDAYWQKNRRLPACKNYVELSDALAPVYLAPLIREDIWNHPLAAFFTSPGVIRLVSSGPDGLLGTADDIEITRKYPA